MPGVEDVAKKHASGLQAQMFQFLSKTMAGKRRFIAQEFATVVAATEYLQTNQKRILTYNIVPDMQSRGYWLTTEEMIDG